MKARDALLITVLIGQIVTINLSILALWVAVRVGLSLHLAINIP